MPIEIRHGAGLDALALAYGTHAEAQRQRYEYEQERKRRHKVKRRQQRNTAVMAGLGAAAIAAPFAAPAIFSGGATAAATTASGQAVAAGMPATIATAAGEAASASYLASATSVMQAGIGALGLAYQTFTPAEEQSAAGNAIFMAGNTAASLQAQNAQRMADLDNQMIRQQQMTVFRSELQHTNWMRMNAEKSELAIQDYMQQWRSSEKLRQTIEDIQNGVSVEGVGSSDLPALERELVLRDAILKGRELKLTEQVSQSGMPMSLEQAKLVLNDTNLKLAKAQDDGDVNTAAQMQSVLDTQVLPAVDLMVAQRATAQQIQAAETQAKQQLIDEKTLDRHPWLPWGQDMSLQETLRWLDTEEGRAEFKRRRRHVLRQMMGVP